MEIVKLIQSLLIYYDSKMYDQVTKSAAKSNTTDLVEELGQVDIIFSDKTGTLTLNEFNVKYIWDTSIIISLENIDETVNPNLVNAVGLCHQANSDNDIFIVSL